MSNITIMSLEDLGVKGIENILKSIKSGFVIKPTFHILQEPFEGYNYWYSFSNKDGQELKTPIEAITSYALQNVLSLNNIDYTIKTDMSNVDLDSERNFMLERADIEVCKLYGKTNR